MLAGLRSLVPELAESMPSYSTPPSYSPPCASLFRYNVLDAPGHKDFIPNMISGTAQADIALLVINSTTGEFETGFNQGGQTREHALLLRSLGVPKVLVVVNKLDTVEWNQARYDELVGKLGQFLQKHIGFDEVLFIPASGLLGTNLVESATRGHPLNNWYNGPSLLEALGE